MASVWALRCSHRLKGKQSRAWLLIAGVLAARVIGTAIDGVIDAGMRQPLPQVPWTTITAIISIPFAIAAAVYMLAERFELSRLRTILDGIIVAISAFFIAWALLIGELVHNTVHNLGGDLSRLASPVANVVYRRYRAARTACAPANVLYWFLRLRWALQIADVASTYYTSAHGLSAGQWFQPSPWRPTCVVGCDACGAAVSKTQDG